MDALRRRGITDGLVIDLGCGSGILSGVVAGAGYRALGIDISEGMVALARKHVPRASFGSSRSYRPSCPVAWRWRRSVNASTICSIQATRQPKLVKLFRRIYACT